MGLDRTLSLLVKFAAIDKLTAPMRAIRGGSKDTAKSLADTRREIRALNQEQARVGALKDLRNGLDGAYGKLDDTRRRVRELKAEIAATDAPTKKLLNSLRHFENVEAKVSAETAEMSGKLERLQGELRDTGIDVSRLAAHEDRLAAKLGEANRRLEQQKDKLQQAAAAQRKLEKTQALGADMRSAGYGMLGAGAVAGAPVVAGAKRAMDLEEGMAGVKKVTNMAGPQLARMSSDILEMSTRIPMAAEGLATIAAAAGAAGIGMDKFGKAARDQRQQLLAFTEDAAKMGVAFDMTAEDAGSTMAKWRTAFAMGQDDVRALGDRVNALTNTFGGKAVNVSDIITRIGPLGKIAGLAAPSVAALASSLDSIGVAPEIAGTGIKNMMLALTKGQAATEAQGKAFAALRLDSLAVAKSMQRDADGTIVNVLDRIRKLSPDQQASILDQLFGSESIAAIAPLLTNLDGLKARLGLVGDRARFAGSMNAEFLARIATTKGATGLAVNSLQALNIKLGQKLLPNIVSAARWVGRTANAVRAWADRNPELAATLAKVAAFAAIALVVLGGMAIVVGTLLGPFAYLGFILKTAGPGFMVLARFMLFPLRIIPLLLKGVWMLAGGIFKAGLFLLANPLVLAITLLVAAIGLLAYWAYKNWDKIKAAFAAGMAFLSGLAGRFREFGSNLIQGLISGVTGRLSALKATIVNAASNVAAWFKSKLGINSPSRLFMQFGGNITEGLAIGVDRGARTPVDRIERIAIRMATAMTVGAAAPALALSPAGGGGASAAAPVAASSGAPTIINIYGAPGQSEAELARLVALEVAKLRRQEAAAARSSYHDD